MWIGRLNKLGTPLRFSSSSIPATLPLAEQYGMFGAYLVPSMPLSICRHLYSRKRDAMVFILSALYPPQRIG